MREFLMFLGVALPMGVVGWWLRQLLERDQIRARLFESPELAITPIEIPRRERPFVRSWWIFPWTIAGIAALTVLFVLSWKWPYALAVWLLIGLIGSEIDRIRIARAEQRIQEQLADAIDLMVGALQAGGSLTSALEFAAKEAREPLRSRFAEMVTRIRLGDQPQAVLRSLVQQVPLENFLLFATSLSVHWEVGGSLAQALSTVGKAIRDRIELHRRVQSLTAQAKFSVIAVLGATYFIAAVIWRSNPERMESFLSTEIGSLAVGTAVILQAIGIAWSSTMSRLKV